MNPPQDPVKKIVSKGKYAQVQSLHQIDITACLDAVDMYDAAYHRDRDESTAVQPEPEAVPLKVVSLWEYLWAKGLITGGGLLGGGLFLTILLAGALIVMNGVHNVYEYQRAQPIIRSGRASTEATTTVKIVRKGINGPDPEVADSGTWSEPSPYPLPPDWIQTNRNLYSTLLLVMFLSHYGSVLCLKRAREINAGVPINYADTAHLPVQESLVRASEEPVRAQQTVLLRAATEGQERHEEQLLRTAGGPE